MPSVIRRVVVAVLLTALLPAQKAPADPVAALLAALAADDVTAASRATAALARAEPRALAPRTAELAPLCGKAPLPALPDLARALGNVALWAKADVRPALVDAGNALDQRGEAFVRAHQAEAPAFADAIARLFARTAVDADAPLEKLLEPIRNEWEHSREAACEALAARGKATAKASPELVPELLGCLLRPRPPAGHTKLAGEYYPMRDAPELALARALRSLAPGEDRIAAAHAAILGRSQDPGERREAAMALGRCGQEGAPFATALIAVLDDATQEVALRREAVTALGMLPAAPEARQCLERHRDDPDPQIAARARAALGHAQPGR